MARSILLAILLGALVGPVHAKGGGSDIQHEREELEAAKDKADKKPNTTAPSFFELIFGGGKKTGNGTK